LIWSLRTGHFSPRRSTEVNRRSPGGPAVGARRARYERAVSPAPGFDEALGRIRAALAARAPRTMRVADYRPAAVLVALLARPEGPTVLFTRRTETVPHHKGEISFPGGGREPGEDAAAAALREADEEVGLPPSSAEIVGTLDDLPSIAGYVVTPVVAAVREPPAAFTAAAFEVVEPFELPLARLLDPTVRRASLWDPARLPAEILAAVRASPVPFEEVDAATGHWRVWSFHADERRVVWGLTARILADLVDRAFR
jgi:8-oxo-dGTP pyrophosphatase MutT (NUDIX family)